MHWLDWLLIAGIPVLVVWDGVRRSAQAKDLDGFLLAGRGVNWWAIGLSVMATQASAITMISIAGHGYEHGMRWLHAYVALPFAMVILCATVVPWFVRARVYTAYEYLEHRFDANTRTLASVLFLISRGLAVGTSLYAPSIVLNLVLGIPQWTGILLMGGISAAYTVFGGNAAVIFTDVKQMLVMFLGIGVSIYVAVAGLPDGIGFGDAMTLAGASQRLEAIHIAPDLQHVLADRYNLVAGLVGGLFLFLGYFGADQSQVQRYLAGKNVEHSRASLLVSAFLKVPMQFAILLLGALIYVFYMFAPAPVFFRADVMDQAIAAAPAARRQVTRPDPARPEVRVQVDAADAWRELQSRFVAAREQREVAARAVVAAQGDSTRLPSAVAKLRADNAAVGQLKSEANALYRQVTGAPGGDGDFIYPWFLLRQLPIGLLGLVIAAIFVAAMSSLDAQLNSLATSSVMDLWVRFRRDATTAQILRLSRWATFFWGAFATVSAFFVAGLGQMIDAVNTIGSMFYGSLFGIFLLGWACPAARGRAGVVALAGGFGCTMFTHFVVNREKVLIDGALQWPVGYFWYNAIGCFGVIAIGFAYARLSPRR